MNVGKEGLILTFYNNEFPEYQHCPFNKILIHFFFKETLVSVVFFKEFGQYTMRCSFLPKDVDGVIFVYDITDRESFLFIEDYCVKTKNNYLNKVKGIILGNKSDLEGSRAVTAVEGDKLSNENGFEFMETSCLKNINVRESFEKIILSICNEKIKEIKERRLIQLKENIEINNGRRCRRGFCA